MSWNSLHSVKSEWADSMSSTSFTGICVSPPCALLKQSTWETHHLCLTMTDSFLTLDYTLLSSLHLHLGGFTLYTKLINACNLKITWKHRNSHLFFALM